MLMLTSTIRDALQDRRGITALEYGLIAALITAVVIPALVLLGPKVGTAMNNLANAF
ncbi:MAG TPA: Flp family type IVb pilin [Roseomonas sp.]